MNKIRLVILTILVGTVLGAGVFYGINSYNKKVELTKTGDVKTVISKVLTFDKIVAEISEAENISKGEAAFAVVGVPGSANHTDPNLATYRSISFVITVDSFYKPTLNLYCQTSEGGAGKLGIVKIVHAEMDRKYNSITKQFGGNVFISLENEDKIFWIVNGDFLNKGTTKVVGDVGIKVGEMADMAFYASDINSYKYIYKDYNLSVNNK